MNILVLGSGGREHTFAWKIKQSAKCDKLFVAPGNAGTAQITENLPISANDFEAIKTAVLSHEIQMVGVGAEDPLVLGIYNYFQPDEELKNISVIAPSKAAAQLEGSREFANELMVRHGVPTAKYDSFTAEP